MTNDFHIWQSVSIFGKEVTAESVKSKCKWLATSERFKRATLDAIWPDDLAICER